MNTVLLLSKIEASGKSKSEIAELLGITRQGLYNKLSGESEFKSSEIKLLSSFLSLTPEDRDIIFFADYVDRTVNNEPKEA